MKMKFIVILIISLIVHYLTLWFYVLLTVEEIIKEEKKKLIKLGPLKTKKKNKKLESLDKNVEQNFD